MSAVVPKKKVKVLLPLGRNYTINKLI